MNQKHHSRDSLTLPPHYIKISCSRCGSVTWTYTVNLVFKKLTQLWPTKNEGFVN